MACATEVCESVVGLTETNWRAEIPMVGCGGVVSGGGGGGCGGGGCGLGKKETGMGEYGLMRGRGGREAIERGMDDLGKEGILEV